MTKTIRFSKFFAPAAIISTVIVVFSVFGFIYNKGFNLGVDFQAGLIQEVQLAPAALSIEWTGTSSALLSHDANSIYIILSGSGVESKTITFRFDEYTSLNSLVQAMTGQIEYLEISVIARNVNNINTRKLLFGAQNNPYLGRIPYIVNYIDDNSQPIDIADVRSAMSVYGNSVSIQSMRQAQDRHFMIRVQDIEDDASKANTSSGVKSEEITRILRNHFGENEVVVLRSDFVGSRFSKNLTDQAGILIALTLVLILGYVTIRFKPQYAIGSVVAIINDVIVVIAFVVWTRMEFTTSTIAAFLTILGYSINNTVVVFDRIRENRRVYPENSFVDILDISLTGVLSRTIITTLTTMLAVISLYIFTTGSMKDFALALIVGLISGIYTTYFISTGIVYYWEAGKIKREKRRAK